jgi:hypothetical protein
VDAYGSGSLPVITRNSNGATVSISGAFITIQNLQLSATPPAYEAGCANNPKGNTQGVSLEAGSHDNLIQNNTITGHYARVFVRSGSYKNSIINNTFTNNNMMSPLTLQPTMMQEHSAYYSGEMIMKLPTMLSQAAMLVPMIIPAMVQQLKFMEVKEIIYTIMSHLTMMPSPNLEIPEAQIILSPTTNLPLILPTHFSLSREGQQINMVLFFAPLSTTTVSISP